MSTKKLHLVSFATCLALGFRLPSLAAPPQPTGQSLETFKQAALLGFDAPDYKELESAWLAVNQDKIVLGMAHIDKLLAKHPDCLYLHVHRARLLGLSGGRNRVIADLQKALKIAENKGDHYQQLYESLVDAYAKGGDAKSEAALLEKMLVLFPHSKASIMENLLAAYRHCRDPKKISESIGRLHQLGKSEALPVSPLLAIQPSAKGPLPDGSGYEFVARTQCFSRFKFTTNGTIGLGETGTAQFVVIPPNYAQLIVVSPESHNCVKMPVNEARMQLCGALGLQPRYSSMTAVGASVVDFIPCVQYKCQWQDDSTFDLITIAQGLAIAEPVAHLQAVIGGLPDNKCVVLGLTRVQGGFPLPILQTYGVKKVKFNTDYCKAAANFHQVKTIEELIYADEGDLKKEDLNKFLKSRQP